MSDRAAELVKQAEKEKSRWFVSKEQKDSNAADALEEAANIYKSQNMHKEAADCFSRSAKLKTRIGKAYEAAEMLKMAGIQLKLDGDPASQSMLNTAVEIFSELGKGQMAAKLSQELGEGSEQAKEYEEAIVHFLRAADLYKGEGQDAYARQCMEKVAHCHAAMVPPDYLKAAAIFEELGVDALSSRLGRFNARKFFFRAVLCTMATSDTIGARARQTHCQEVDYQFSASREGKFLNQLLTALEAFDAEQFSEAYCDYVDISPLDPWHTTLLRQAQKVLTGEVDEIGGMDDTGGAGGASGAAADAREAKAGDAGDAANLSWSLEDEDEEEQVPGLPPSNGAGDNDKHDDDEDDYNDAAMFS